MSAPHPDPSLPTVLLVLPCYNPETGWEGRVFQLADTLASQLPEADFRIAVVNDGSARGIAVDSQQQLPPHATLLHLPHNMGKGQALRTGFGSQQASYYIFSDIDLPFGVEGVIQVARALMQGDAEVVVGKRESPFLRDMTLQRKVISSVFRWVQRLVFGGRELDTQCGLKGFGQQGRRWFLATATRRFLVDFEFLLLVSRYSGLSLHSLPVAMRPGISFSRFGPRVLATELGNLARILGSVFVLGRGRRLRRQLSTPRG